jgi:ABC-2 type transport system permease protein
MRRALKNVRLLFLREMYGYFCTPIAYIFLVIFLILTGIFTFGDNLGNFYGRGVADLSVSFFIWHPWLFMMFVPAVGMRLWSEELEHGTLELLTTLPTKLWHAVAAKFLAGAAVLALALILTFPVVLTVNYLGSPDNGKILCGYLGSFLMAAAFLSVGSLTSACTRNQVVSFIVSLVMALLLILCGFPPIVNMLRQFLPEFVTQLISQWSIYTHFENMQRGVVDLSDLVYFAGVIGFGLIATLISLEKKPWKWTKVAGLVILLMGVAVIGSHHGKRLDLTVDGRHTLSEGSGAIVGRVGSPVTISFYFSRSEKAVPQPIKDFARRVEGLLAQYEAAGNEKVIVRVIDAQPDSALEDTMIHLGIEPRILAEREKHFYMGIEVAHAGKSIVMPILEMDKERNLEFEISRAIQRVTSSKRKVVGMITGLPVLGRSLKDNPFGMRASSTPWIFVRELKKDYEIRELSAKATELPSDLDLLILYHPRELSDSTMFLVDQYLMNGGNLVVMVDPLCSVSLQHQKYRVPDPKKHTSTLEPLFSAWGVTFGPHEVVVDPGNSVEKSKGTQPAFLELDTEAMGRLDVVSATLQKLRPTYSHPQWVRQLSRKATTFC